MQFKCIIIIVLMLCIAAPGAIDTTADSSASRHVDPKRSSGDRIVLTAKDIRDMNVQSVHELLNHLPGITAGETYVRIQGATDVKVLFDGRPLNDPLSHGGIKWNLVSIRDIEKMEILMGGGAAMAGDGTSGGTILLTGKKNESAHGHIDAAGGNYGTQNFTFRFGQQTDIVTMGASGNYEYTEGYQTNNDKCIKRAGVRVGLDGDNSDNVAGLSLDYATDDRGYPGKPQWSTPYARGFSKNINSSLYGKWKTTSSNIYYSETYKTTENPDQPLSTEFDGTTIGTKTAHTVTLGKTGPVIVGAEAQYDAVAGFRKTAGTYTQSLTSDYKADEWVAGAWATKSFVIPAPVAPLSIVTGLRCNYYSTFPVNLNPEIRINFTLWKINFNSGAAIMHNAPTLYKRYYESSTTVCNPGLMPERGTNTALGAGYSGRLGSCGVSTNIQLFNNYISDRITYVSSISSAMGRYGNIGSVLRRGADLSLGVKLDSLIPHCESRLDMTAGFLDARDLASGLHLTSSPKSTVKFTAGIKLFNVLSGRLTGVYTGKQYTTTDNLSTSDPNFLLCASAEYTMKKIVIYVRGENILNTTYSYSDGYPGPPREYESGIRCEF